MDIQTDTYPNFNAILYEIKKYKEININKHQLNLKDKELKFKKVRFYFKGNILYCEFLTEKYTEIPENTVNVKHATMFGKYVSDNSLINEVQHVYRLNSIPMQKIKMSLHEIHFGKQNKFNIALLPCHQNLGRLDQAIKFGPKQGHFSLGNINFSVYLICEECKYIALLADKSLPTQEFQKYLIAIKTGLDFINCESVEGDVFFFLTNDEYSQVKNMLVKPMSSKAKLNFNIFIDDLYPLATLFTRKYGEKTKYLTAEQFGKLCQLLWQDKQVAATVNYILQSSNLWLEFHLVFLSVALEAITKYCHTSHLLFNDTKYEQLKKEIMDLIDKQENLSDNEKETIKGKIKNISNSKSNFDLLKAPFEQNGIDILPEDKEVLKKRNRILHGEAPTYSDNVDDDIKEYDRELKVLYSLLYRLILKLVGYEGYILNLKQWNNIQEYHNKFSSLENTVNCEDFFTIV